MAARTSPQKLTLRELMSRQGYSLNQLALCVGVERATLRQKLDAHDMLLSSLEEILTQMGFDLEVRATTPDGGSYRLTFPVGPSRRPREKTRKRND